MYIFEDLDEALPPIDSNVSVLPRAKKLANTEFYASAYRHLRRASLGSYQDFDLKTNETVTKWLKSSDYLLTERCSSRLSDPEFRFVVGSIGAKSLLITKDSPQLYAPLLDSTAIRLLDNQFNCFEGFGIKIKGFVYNSWEGFAQGYANQLRSNAKLPFKLSYSEVDKRRGSKKLQGTLSFREDVSGFYPVHFEPNSRGYQSYSMGKSELADINGVLKDHWVRRSMAQEYLSLPNSKLLDERTFQKMMDHIVPLIDKRKIFYPSVFDPLRGGKAALIGTMILPAAYGRQDSLSFKVTRCSKCGQPNSLNVIPVDDVAPGEKVKDAAVRATVILMIAHGKTC